MKEYIKDFLIRLVKEERQRTNDETYILSLDEVLKELKTEKEIGTCEDCINYENALSHFACSMYGITKIDIKEKDFYCSNWQPKD
jgi:hypothetical protein